MLFFYQSFLSNFLTFSRFKFVDHCRPLAQAQEHALHRRNKPHTSIAPSTDWRVIGGYGETTPPRKNAQRRHQPANKQRTASTEGKVARTTLRFFSSVMGVEFHENNEWKRWVIHIEFHLFRLTFVAYINEDAWVSRLLHLIFRVFLSEICDNPLSSEMKRGMYRIKISNAHSYLHKSDKTFSNQEDSLPRYPFILVHSLPCIPRVFQSHFPYHPSWYKGGARRANEIKS